MPKVSILMPACNVEKFLRECMDSVVKPDIKRYRDYLYR